jgi:hypothetical protein
MSVQLLLLKVSNLTERLQLTLESGAKQILVPSENKRDLADESRFWGDGNPGAFLTSRSAQLHDTQ